MPWFKQVCVDAICGACLGALEGAFGVSCFTAEEARELQNLKNLADAAIAASKSLDMVTDPIVCDAIRKGQISGLDNFAKSASAEAIAAGVVTAADLVCTKSFKKRFTEALMGACLNIVRC